MASLRPQTYLRSSQATKCLACAYHATVLKNKFLHFKDDITRTKDTNGKGKFERILSFLFVHKRKLFVTKLYLEEFHLAFFTAERLACFGLTKASKFLKNFKYILYSIVIGKYVFKTNNWIYKGFTDVLYIFGWA